MTSDTLKGLLEYDHDLDEPCCPYCGGEGILDDWCECSAFEDTCCCAEPTPRECPHCVKKSGSPELQSVLSEALHQSSKKQETA